MRSLFASRHNREHRFAAANLSAYLDGALSRRERERVERHLAACQPCRDDLATLRQTVALLRAAPKPALPRSFVLPVSARETQARYRVWGGVYAGLRTAALAASIALVLLLSGDALLGIGARRMPHVFEANGPKTTVVEAAPEMLALESDESAVALRAEPEAEATPWGLGGGAGIEALAEEAELAAPPAPREGPPADEPIDVMAIAAEEPLPPLWRVWQVIRLASGVVAGLVLVLLAGVLWSGRKQRL